MQRAALIRAGLQVVCASCCNDTPAQPLSSLASLVLVPLADVSQKTSLPSDAATTRDPVLCGSFFKGRALFEAQKIVTPSSAVPRSLLPEQRMGMQELAG